jgi:hypothetical protein
MTTIHSLNSYFEGTPTTTRDLFESKTVPFVPPLEIPFNYSKTFSGSEKSGCLRDKAAWKSIYPDLANPENRTILDQLTDPQCVTQLDILYEHDF